MKTSVRLLVSSVSLVAACWLAGCASPASTAEAAAKPGEIKVVKGRIPVLEIGLTAAAIREKLGAPAEIQPMDTAEKQAEIWIYRFERPLRVAQIPTTMASLPATTEADYTGQIRMVQEPQYSVAEQKSQLTLQLLVFKGRLAAQKILAESSNHYN